MELMLSLVIELEMDCYGSRDQTINESSVSVNWGPVTIVWMSVSGCLVDIKSEDGHLGVTIRMQLLPS